MIAEIYILIIGFFLCLSYFMLVGYNKSYKEIFSFSILMISLNIIYCIVTYAVFNSLGHGPTLFYLGGLLGVSLTLNYLYLIEAFFKRKLKFMGLLKCLIFLFVFFLGLDLTQSFFTNQYLYLKASELVYSNLIVINTIAGLEITSTGKMIGTISGVSAIIALVYTLIGYRAELRDEKFLRYGLYLSFVAMFNDLMVGGADIAGVIPLFFIAYIFESLRFSRFFYDKYKLERDQVINHLQENVSLDLSSDYTKAFAHDLRGIIRKNSPDLSAPLKKSFTNLIDLYSPINDKNVSITNAIKTALLIFQSEIENKDVEFKHDLSGLKNITNQYPVNSNILCSILYGLFQNALEAVEQEAKKVVGFEVTADEYFMTCIIRNTTTNLHLDPETNLPIREFKSSERGNGLALIQNLAKTQHIDLEAKYEDGNLEMIVNIPI